MKAEYQYSKYTTLFLGGGGTVFFIFIYLFSSIPIDNLKAVNKQVQKKSIVAHLTYQRRLKRNYLNKKYHLDGL